MAVLSSVPPPSAQAAFVPFELVSFGGSAGGIQALIGILSRLPDDFPIPIVVVQHLGAHLKSRLPEVLGYRTKLRCKWAEHGERPRPGLVLVAPAGRNLTLTAAGTLRLEQSAKPQLGWPSVDLFLSSVAAHLGPHAIAVVLSGMMHDGAQGISAVRRRGGATLAQHPATAVCDGMPSAAVDLGRADLMMSLATLAQALEILAETGVV